MPSRSPRPRAPATRPSAVTSWNRPSARSTPKTARRSSCTSWTSCRGRSSPRSSAFPTPRRSTTACIARWRCCVSASNGPASDWRTCEQSSGLPSSHDGDVMSHPDPLDPLRRVLALHAAGAPEQPTLECLDDDTLAALAEGSLSVVARATALGHVASCPRCRSIVASVARALADSGVAREVPSPGSAGRRRFLQIALPAAAAAVLLVLAWPRPGAVRDPARGHARGAARLDPSRSRSALSVEGRSTHRLAALVGVGAGRVFDRGRPAPVMPLGAPLFLAALVVQSGPSDSLRFTAMRLPEPALVLETRARPFAVRDAISDALARGELDAARRIAAAYAVAWRDSFLVREVERFAAWPLERRAAKVWADSARRAGIAAYGRDGATAAIRIWWRALGRITPIDDTAGVAGLLGNIGAGLLAESRVDTAVTYLDRARLLASSVGDTRGEANAAGALAGVSEDRGDLAAAQAGYVRALALRERIGDTRGAAADHNNLGLLAQTGGDLDEAHRQFEAALALNRHDGRDEVAATNLVNLAGLASVDGDFALAVRLYRDALATWRAREQWADAAAALHGLGQVELRRGDYPAARASLGEALAIYDRTGPLADALAVRRDLAGALAAAGELQGALDELRHAQRLADSARASPGVRAGIALARAALAARLNTPAEAERLYARAEFLYRQAGDLAGGAEAQPGRGLPLLDRDDYGRARTLLDGALPTPLAAGNPRAAALTRLSLGELSQARGDTTAAPRQRATAAAH